MTAPPWLAWLALAAVPVLLGVNGAWQGAPEDGRAVGLASWPHFGSDAQRSFQLAEPGHHASYAYAPWELRPGYLPPETGNGFVATAVGDLDGDGFEEVVARIMPLTPFPIGNASLQVWEHDGSVRWTQEGVNDAVFLDVGGDGAQELFFTRGVRHWLVDGERNMLWTSITPQLASCGFTCTMALAADVTHDGVPDVVMLATPPTQQYVFALDGRDGSLVWQFYVPCGWAVARPLAFQDAGRTVVVVTCRNGATGDSYGGVEVYALATVPRPVVASAPTGGIEASHAAEILWRARLADTPPRRGEWSIQEGPDVWGLAAGDVNGDGSPEIVVALWSEVAPETIVVLDSAGRRLATLTDDPGRLPRCCALADLDGDGVSDIVLGHLEGGVDAYAFRDGGLTRLWHTPLDGDPFVGSADFDGDGRDEVVTFVQQGNYCEDGSGGYVAILGPDGAPRWKSPLSDKCTMPTVFFALADLDRDGDIEILAPAASRFHVFGAGPQPGPGQGSSG